MKRITRVDKLLSMARGVHEHLIGLDVFLGKWREEEALVIGRLCERSTIPSDATLEHPSEIRTFL